MNDLKFALRQLLKNPGFTLVAVLTLALGIGANTAIFSFVNTILLRSLPFPDSARLVQAYENHQSTGARKVGVAPPILHAWRSQNTVFEALTASRSMGLILTGRGDPEGLAAGQLSANMFSLLRVKPRLGRPFLAEEETFGKHHVALLSHELWERRFGSDPGIIGQNITLSDESYTVIGVMPPRLFFPHQNTQIWIPLAFAPGEAANRQSHNYDVYGRLRPGFTLAQAEEELDLISRRIAEGDPQSKGWGAELLPLREVVVGDSKATLLALLGSAGAVLLIACANIAGLLLARSATRAREFTIRVALGAQRGQMVRQLLTESLLLSGVGALAGLLLASVGLPILIRITPTDLPRIWEGVRIDGWSLGFACAISVITGLLFGLAPAIQAANRGLAGELGETSRGSSAGQRRQRIRRGLVIAEVAVSMMLLVGAGLAIRSFGRILSQPLGYNPEKVVSFEIGLTDQKYEGSSAPARFFETLLANVRSVPGMHSAALVAGLPLANWDANVYAGVDGLTPSRPDEGATAQYAQVSPGYFATMGIPLVAGRDFSESDRESTTPVVIVNEAFVKEFKLGPDALRGHLTLGDGAKHAEIIGVVRNIKRTDLAVPARSEMYRPYHQACWGQMRLIVRTERSGSEAAAVVRAQLNLLDKDVPVLNIRSMADLLDSSLAQRRLAVQLLVGFGALAMVLSAVGLYGIIAYHVAQRTREIGIRIALGAQPDAVAWLVLREGMLLMGVGILAGLAGAFALTGVMRRWVYEIAPTDPATYVSITLLLVLVGALACWLPARRATRVDPISALRTE